MMENQWFDLSLSGRDKTSPFLFSAYGDRPDARRCGSRATAASYYGAVLARAMTKPLSASTFYMSFTDWDGGLVAGNLLIHQNSHKVTNVYGILFNQMPHKGEGVRCRNVSINDNIVYGLRNTQAGITISGGKGSFSGISISGNQIQFPGLQSPVIRVEEGPVSGISFSKNTYFSGLDLGKWFDNQSGVGDRSMDFKAWVAATGETGLEAKEIHYKDPSRTVETYNASLGGKADFEDFIAQVRKQSKTNWRKEYTAAAVNAYIREGFRLKPGR